MLPRLLLADLKDSSGAPVELSETDLKVLLKFLARDKKVAQVSGEVSCLLYLLERERRGADSLRLCVGNEQTIKLAHTKGEAVPPITEQDRGVVQLRSTHAKLEDQVADIERRIAE